MALICAFLMVNDVEQFCLCSWVVCTVIFFSLGLSQLDFSVKFVYGAHVFRCALLAGVIPRV